MKKLDTYNRLGKKIGEIEFKLEGIIAKKTFDKSPGLTQLHILEVGYVWVKTEELQGVENGEE